MTSKPTCLIVASAASAGVSARSFQQCFNLCNPVFNLQTATPGGKSIDFTGVDDSTGRWVQEFSIKPYANPAKLESIDEPVCAVGQGVAALCCATEEQKWIFSRYSMTGPSVFELVRSSEFANLPLIVEDFIKDNGGSYTASIEDAVHVVLDRHLITGQNIQSTTAAVNNLILLCNNR
ncbi:glutamine amidotransferase-like class 1 domain-containing protein 1 isoform X1 [Danio rerio]|uniref:Glutamine amidotransferase-like class 1 domain-containing protein 1 n=1 Tax=Danio rerio TaxID=7955 RepID=A0AB32TDD6_DANRE